MKKLMPLLLLVICIFQFNAQNIKKKCAYQFNTFVEVDNNLSYQCSGLIVFSVAGSHEFITIMIGDEVLFNGEIKNKKPAQRYGNEVVYVYLFTTDFMGSSVPIQLFERWDTGKNTTVPEDFVLTIHNVNNGSCVQTQAYEGISRLQIGASNDNYMRMYPNTTSGSIQEKQRSFLTKPQDNHLFNSSRNNLINNETQPSRQINIDPEEERRKAELDSLLNIDYSSAEQDHHNETQPFSLINVDPEEERRKAELDSLLNMDYSIVEYDSNSSFTDIIKEDKDDTRVVISPQEEKNKLSRNTQINNTIWGLKIGKSSVQQVKSVLKKKGYKYEVLTSEAGGTVFGIAPKNGISFGGVNWSTVFFEFYGKILYSIGFQNSQYKSSVDIYSMFELINNKLKVKYSPYLENEEDGDASYNDGKTWLHLFIYDNNQLPGNKYISLDYTNVRLYNKILQNESDEL